MEGGALIPEYRVEWCVEVEANENVPDLVFTANAGLICGNLAIVSSFRHPERRL